MVNYDSAKRKLDAFKIEQGEITLIELLPASEPMNILGFKSDPVPEFCHVSVVLTPTATSRIRVEIGLPVETWNGNYLGCGNGGSAGWTGKDFLYGGLNLGFATAHTDMGTAPDVDELIDDPNRWPDFGYRATHLMTVVAKQLIEVFYGTSPIYSYFTGGSTGGQQALMEAQRYPEDYNGILATAPANNRTNLHVAFIWNWLALTQDPAAAINDEQAAAITRRIVEHYGLTSGSAAHEPFLTHVERVQVDPGIFGDFLNDAQINALKKIYQGPVNPRTGERIYAPVTLPGSEKLPLGLVQQSDKTSFAKDFLYLFRWIFGKDHDFTGFDFDRDIESINEKLAPVLNANSADFSAFKAAGGKLLMLHGLADPIIPYYDSLQYYERVAAAQGGLEATKEFFRYFLIPGWGHGFGGSGVQIIGSGGGLPTIPRDRLHDALIALTDWVERNIPPEELRPIAFKEDKLFREIDYERPVFVFPDEARYVSGDPKNPASYERVAYSHGDFPKPVVRYLT